MNTPSPYLTPSELIYLNGEKFAEKAGVFNKTRLMHMDFHVDTVQLAQAILAGAFFSLEQQGTFRLEMRQKKTLFGLASTQALYADLVSQPAAWPNQTLEAELPAVIQRLPADRGQNEVYNAVYFWLGRDSADPFGEVFEHVKVGLAARGLLESHVETKLKIFKSTVYSCPEFTRQLAAAQPVAPLQQLMGWYQQVKPELWKAMFDQVKKAVSNRKEKSDNDTSFD